MDDSDEILERELEMQNLRTSVVLDEVKQSAGSDGMFRDAVSQYAAKERSSFDDGFDDDFGEGSEIPLTKLDDSARVCDSFRFCGFWSDFLKFFDVYTRAKLDEK
jgi:hypothetical protein